MTKRLTLALQGHPTLARFSMRSSPAGIEHFEEVGPALGRLVSHPGSVLTSLDVAHCHLGDANQDALDGHLRRLGIPVAKSFCGLDALFAALPRNLTLRHLDVSSNEVARRFAAVLLRAVRANTSLQCLSADNSLFPQFSIRDLKAAECLVAARRPTL